MDEMQHTAHDRCDRCGAQGYTTWVQDESWLTFCGHHTRTYESQLLLDGFELLIDDTGILAAG